MFGRLLLLVAPLCAAALGQVPTSDITDLTSNEDGSVLYVATSLRVKGSPHFSHGKIYRWTGGQFQLVASEPVPQEMTGPHRNIRPPYAYIAVEASADGNVLALTKLGDCTGGSACAFVDLRKSEVRTAAGNLFPDTPGAYSQISPNGRYALYEEQSYSMTRGYHWVDLATGVRITIPPEEFRAARRGALSDDGGVIGVTPTSNDQRIVIRIRDGRQLYFATSSRPMTPIMDARGRRAFWGTESRDLYITDLTTSSEKKIAGSGVPVAISSDANRFLYRAGDFGSEPWIYDAATGTTRRVPGVPEGVVAFAMSGNGRFVFMSTPLNRLVRVEIASDATIELVPQTPAIPRRFSVQPSQTAPGGLISIIVNGVDGKASALPLDLRIEASGQNLRPLRHLAGSSPWAAEVELQLPFDVQTGSIPLRLISNGSPLEGASALVNIGASNAYSLQSKPVHGDFHGLVTEEDPAVPGEIIHLYVSGLGAVAPPVPAGTVTPSSPLSRALRDPDVLLYRRSIPLRRPRLLFAGLAPGFIGIYQVSIQLPPREALPSDELQNGILSTYLQFDAPGAPQAIFPLPIRL